MKYVFLAALSLILVSTPPLLAQPGSCCDGMGPGRGPRMGGRMERHEAMMQKLDLSDEQQKQMDKLRLDLEKKMQQVRSKIGEARLDLRSAFAADKPDRAAIEKTLKSISELQYQEKMNWTDHWFAVYGLLNPKQQEVWKKFAERPPAGQPRGNMRGPGRWQDRGGE